MSLYLPGAGTLGCAVWPGAGITHSQGIPPDFYLPYMNVGLPVLIPLLLQPPPLHVIPHLLASLPHLWVSDLLPVWMNVASLNPWLSDFHTVRFFDSSGYYLFLDLVVILWLHEEAKHVYLCLHLDHRSHIFFFFNF